MIVASQTYVYSSILARNIISRLVRTPGHHITSRLVHARVCACHCNAAVVSRRQQEVLVKGKRERVGHESKKLAMTPSAQPPLQLVFCVEPPRAFR